MEYRNQSPFWSAAESTAVSRDEGLRAYLLGVYNYMASALALTGIAAYAGANFEPIHALLYVQQGGHTGLSGLGYLVMFAPLLFVIGLSAGINRMSVSAAQITFWAYAAVMGLSLSSLFFVYTGRSLVSTFFVTSIVFGSMGMWGYSSKRDLTSMGHFMMMGLFGIIIASLVNIFIGSSAVNFAVSALGVVIFTGLTAYDTQRIKQMYYQAGGNAEAAAKTSIMGALQLYLDFINLFIHLLRFMGDRK